MFAGARPLLIFVSLTLAGGVPARGLAQDVAPNEIEYSVEAPLASRSLLLDGVAVEDRIVAVGEWGHVLLSDDHGRSWRQAKVPTRATLTAVFFHDENLGWAVGHDATILRSRDGGENWERVHFAPEEERPFFDIWFTDAKNGFAIGAYAFFLGTTDGGETWSQRQISGGDDLTEDYDAFLEGSDYHLNHIARSGTGRLYIAAEAGTIYRSDDDGQTWISLPSPYHGSFFGTLPLENDSLLLFGLRGHMYRSEDAGESWEQVETSTEAMLTNGLRLKDGTVLVTGLAGTLLFSEDGGRRFDLRLQADRQGLATVIETDDDGLILIGEFGVTKLPQSETAIDDKGTLRP